MKHVLLQMDRLFSQEQEVKRRINIVLMVGQHSNLQVVLLDYLQVLIMLLLKIIMVVKELTYPQSPIQEGLLRLFHQTKQSVSVTLLL